jgi:hypothetical protein
MLLLSEWVAVTDVGSGKKLTASINRKRRASGARLLRRAP